ncbi:MAG TPA: PfkB family carbohydrate kinase [Dongiaceae bacterium]|jgi:pseudouridine kinase|nr:PfkB family carbohydrate kinase [Dongiaceae bacterium]
MSALVCIGGANLDLKFHFMSAPHQGTSNPARASFSPGGVARNVAANLAALGHAPKLVTILGSDFAAEEIRTRSPGIDFSLSQRSASHPSGFYCAYISPEGELLQAASAMEGLEDLTPARLQDIDASTIFADCNLRVDSLAFLAARPGSALFIDPVSISKVEKLHAVLDRPITALSPNRGELAALFGVPVRTEADIAQACRALHDRNVYHVMVGCGAEGAYFSARNGEGFFLPSQVSSCVDVTGCGDAAVAALMHGLMAGWPFRRAAELAQAAAAVTCASRASVAENIGELRHAAF